MQRVRFQLPQQSWGTTVTKYPANDSHVGPDDFTSGSKNFETDTNGTIQKRLGDVNYEVTPASGTVKDLYEAVFIDGSHHLLRLRSGTLEYSSGSGSFASVTAGYSAIGNFEFAQYADRVYFGNGIDNPQVYDRTANYGGVAYTTPKTKVMGVQAPGSAPTVAVGAAGNVPAGSYTYKVTFVYYDFEESNGGSASAVVSPGVASIINLSAIPVGGYGVTARKVYRSNDGGLSYRLVATIPDNTTTTLADNVATATAFIPTDNGTPRNFSLIVQHKDRLWVAGIPGDKSDLDYSAASLPDVWPSLNTAICNPRDPITGLIVYNDRVMVFNRNSFGMILGNSPDNFRYSEVPGNIGCVDNRTLQVRVLHGVPILVWLSDKGFYAYNGSTVEYISDEIEDLVNFNIQQASQVKGSNAQSSQSDFQSGYYVANGGIDLTSNPGVITTPNPKYLIDERAEWEGGSSVQNIATRVSADHLAMARRNTFSRSGGSLSGLILSSGNITLTQRGYVLNSSPGLGAVASAGFAALSGTPQAKIAGKFTVDGPNTATNVSVVVTGLTLASSGTGRVLFMTDSAGNPGSTIYTSGTLAWPQFGATLNFSVSVPLTTGTYWVVFEILTGSTDPSVQRVNYSNIGVGDPTYSVVKTWNGASWVTQTIPSGKDVRIRLTGTYTPVSAAGTWTSDVYDSGLFSQAASIATGLTYSAIKGGLCSFNTYIDESDDSTFTVGVTSSSAFSGINGSNSHSFTPAVSRRYWRVRMQLSTSDTVQVPSITSDPVLSFPSSVTWISQPIDGTLETSGMNTLEVVVPSLPAGTSVTAYVQKATSVGGPYTDEYSSALVAGTNTLNISGMTNPTYRFNRIKLVLSNSSSPTSTPQVASAKLAWTISTSILSQVIDTGSTPAGWDVFQASVTNAGAGASFSMRSDPTSAALTDDVPSGPFSPSFVAVTNGAFPTGVPINRYVQWKLALIATEDSVPVVDSVTVNWFVSLVSSLRPASLFYDKSYYVSLARYNSSTNDLILRLDPNGNWEIWEDQSVGTFSLFFSEPYFGDAGVAQVRKFLSGSDDHGNAIPLDVRFKAFDFEDMTKRKILRQVFLVVENTGATYTVDFSLDRGQTFLPLYDASGSTSFTVSSNNDVTTKRLVPGQTGNGQGQTILLRVRESTTSTAKIHEIQIDAYLRQGDIIDG